MLLSFNGTKCKHCIMACLSITHNKQDTSIVALITLLWIIHPIPTTNTWRKSTPINICLESLIWLTPKQALDTLLASILDQVSKGSASNCRSKLKPYCWFWSQCTKSVIVSILSTLLPAAWWCIWTFHGRTLLISRRTQVHPPPRPQLRAKVNKKLEWNGPSEGVRVSGVVI